MKTRRLLMTKPQTYGTRELKAGDECDVPELDAIKMVLKRQARFAPRVRTAPQPEAVVEEKIAAQADVAAEPNSIDSLRAEAAQLGIDVDGRWGVARLQHEITQAKR
jgi:hypothetical protein